MTGASAQAAMVHQHRWEAWVERAVLMSQNDMKCSVSSMDWCTLDMKYHRDNLSKSIGNPRETSANPRETFCHHHVSLCTALPLVTVASIAYWLTWSVSFRCPAWADTLHSSWTSHWGWGCWSVTAGLAQCCGYSEGRPSVAWYQTPVCNSRDRQTVHAFQTRCCGSILSDAGVDDIAVCVQSLWPFKHGVKWGYQQCVQHPVLFDQLSRTPSPSPSTCSGERLWRTEEQTSLMPVASHHVMFPWQKIPPLDNSNNINQATHLLMTSSLLLAKIAVAVLFCFPPPPPFSPFLVLLPLALPTLSRWLLSLAVLVTPFDLLYDLLLCSLAKFSSV